MTLPFSKRISVAAAIVARGWHSIFDRPGMDTSSPNDSLRNAYAESVWVMRAIKNVAGPVASVPLLLSIGERKILDPVLDAFWKAPAVGLDWVDFVEASVGWLKMDGEVFWLLDDAAIVPFPEAKLGFPKLAVARPDRMTEVKEAGAITGWRFTDADGRQHVLLPEQVIHLRCWNPANNYRGQGELDPARVAAEADYLAGKFNLNLMRNNGDRGAYVICKGGIPDEDQRKQIVAQLQQKRADALRGNYRPAFLTGDFSIEDPKVQSLDAAILASRLQNRHEIFIAFGVPPSMADIAASYSIGSASDRFRLIEDTCMPIGVKICGGIASVLQKLTKKPITAALSWEDHSVMLQVRAERIDSARKIWDMGVPLKTINEYLRLKMPEVEGWDTGYLPFGLSPVSEVESGANNPQTAPGFEEPAATEPKPNQTESLKRLFNTKIAKNAKVDAEIIGLACKARDPREVARWTAMMAKRRTVIRAYKSKFDRILMRARAETLAKIGSEPLRSLRSSCSRSVAADFIFDAAKFSDGLVAGLRQVARSGLQVAGQQLFEEIKRDDPFVMPDPKVLEFLASRENKIKDCADSIYEEVKDQLAEGIKGGQTMSELSDRVRAAFNDISDERAERIAMTETAAVYGEARQVALEEAGIEWKQWLTSGNDNVRPAHQEANGQVVRTEEAFDVMGEQLMQPGDPEGSAANVINCHCVAIAVAKGPET